MREFSKTYFDSLIEEIQSIRMSDSEGNPIETFEGIKNVAKLILSESQKGRKLIFIGNGYINFVLIFFLNIHFSVL